MATDCSINWLKTMVHQCAALRAQDMINIIRENTHKMENQLELLQNSDVDPRKYNGILHLE